MIITSFEELQQQKSDLAQAIENTDVKVVRSALYSKLSEVEGQLRKEEFRQNYKKKMRVIDGIEVEVPRFFDHNKDLAYKDGCLYDIDKGKKLDSDGSFSWHHYVYIPGEDKHTVLCVRTLGGDRYGDRYYLSTSYYKHASDSFSYMHKDISVKNKTYKSHLEHVLKEIGWDHLLEGK